MSLIQSTMSWVQSNPLDLYLSLQKHLELENVERVDEVSRNVSDDDLVKFDTESKHLLLPETIKYIEFLRDRVNNISAFTPSSTLQQQYVDDDVNELMDVLCFSQEEYKNETESRHLFAQNLAKYLNDDGEVVKS